MKYSNGGHMLAAAYNKISALHYKICIINCYTMEKIQKLDSHTVKITEIQWSYRDSFLYSCGKDGKLFQWSCLNWWKKEFTHNNIKLTTLAITHDSLLVMGGYQKNTNYTRTNMIFKYKFQTDICEIVASDTKEKLKQDIT